MQTSDTFSLSAFLSFSGGLQDAYTYNTRGGIFANAQTGNVVLMSQNFMLGNYRQGIYYLIPLLSFTTGIYITERIETAYKNRSVFHWRQIILLIEIVALSIVGLLPAELDMLANIIVSFACAMQVQTFRKVHGYGYASTMCIGNLRSGTESLSRYFRDKDRAMLRKALHFFGIIIIFALGAGAGGVLSLYWGKQTIWISAFLLLIVELMMIRKGT